MSMLLMYYDTFWHEDFVPGDLEWVPGEYDVTNDVLLSTFSEVDEYDAWYDFSVSLTEEQYVEGFKNFALANSDNYLQSHLFDIGWNRYENTVYRVDAIKYIVFPYMAEYILEKYLYDEVGFSEDTITIHKESGTIDQLRSQMVGQISNGNPVLFFGATFEGLGLFNDDLISDDKTGHIMLAYKTDDSGEIYLNNGWNGTDSEFKLSETEYIYHNYIVWIEIDKTKLTHLCSNNYVDSNNSNTKYCACQIYEDHDAHSGHHIFLDKSDENYHWQECHCGEKINIEPHVDYTYTRLNSSTHRKKCKDCGYSTIEDHILDKLSPWGEECHNAECECGYSSLRDHSTGYILGDHDAYCDCGQYLGIEHVEAYTENNNDGTHNVYCGCDYLMGSEEHSRGYCEYNSLRNHNIYCGCGQYLGREVHTPVNKLGKTYCSGCLCVLDDDDISLVNGSKDDPDSLTE